NATLSRPPDDGRPWPTQTAQRGELSLGTALLGGGAETDDRPCPAQAVLVEPVPGVEVRLGGLVTQVPLVGPTDEGGVQLAEVAHVDALERGSVRAARGLARLGEHTLGVEEIARRRGVRELAGARQVAVVAGGPRQLGQR